MTIETPVSHLAAKRPIPEQSPLGPGHRRGRRFIGGSRSVPAVRIPLSFLQMTSIQHDTAAAHLWANNQRFIRKIPATATPAKDNRTTTSLLRIPFRRPAHTDHSQHQVMPIERRSSLPFPSKDAPPGSSEAERAGWCKGNDISQLVAQSHQHRAVRHPYLRALGRGDLPDPRGALQDFARHYHGYSSHFPRYLTALISRLEDDSDRCMLLENVREESGCYSQQELGTLQTSGIQPEWVSDVPHPELFRRFRRALGVADDEPAEEHPEVIAWRELLLAVLSQGSAAEAVGALGLGTEGIVPVIYPAFVDALRGLGDVAPRDGVFFLLHTLIDDHHQASLQTLARKLGASRKGRRDLRLGMTKALALRDTFWSWLHQRALAMAPAGAGARP